MSVCYYSHFCLLFCILCNIARCQLIENRSGLGLTRVPTDLNISAEALYLDDNALTSIILPPGFTRLYKLSAKINFLTAFPDLRTIATSVKQVILMKNQISYIEPRFLDALTLLEKLQLGENLLSHIPDVSGPSTTLTTLYIYANRFEEIPPLKHLGRSLTALYIGDNLLKKLTLERFLEMPHLISLGMIESLVKTLPNFCQFHFTVEVNMETSPRLVCDCHLRWLKVMQASGINIKLGHFPCAQPADMMNRNWSTIGLQEMSCTGDLQSFYMHPVAPTYSCLYPGLVEVQSSKDVLSCAVKCVHSPSCLMFGYDHTKGVLTDNCAITDISTMTSSLLPPLAGTWNWYTVE